MFRIATRTSKIFVTNGVRFFSLMIMHDFDLSNARFALFFKKSFQIDYEIFGRIKLLFLCIFAFVLL